MDWQKLSGDSIRISSEILAGILQGNLPGFLPEVPPVIPPGIHWFYPEISSGFFLELVLAIFQKLQLVFRKHLSRCFFHQFLLGPFWRFLLGLFQKLFHEFPWGFFFLQEVPSGIFTFCTHMYWPRLDSRRDVNWDSHLLGTSGVIWWDSYKNSLTGRHCRDTVFQLKTTMQTAVEHL